MYNKLTPVLILISLAACKTTQPVKLGVDELAAPSTPAEPAATTGKLTPEMTRAIYAGLGCPEASITLTGCQVCPVFDSALRDTPMVELDDEQIEIKLEPGVYSEEPGAQVLASFDGCQEGGAGTYRVTDVVHLIQEDDGAWVPRSSVMYEDLRACQQVAITVNMNVLVCDTLSGRMGTYNGQHEVVHWSQLDTSGDSLPSPLRQTLLYGAMGESCAENFSVGYDVKMTPADLDSDGLIDLTLDVTTNEGPFAAPIEECPDGDLESPLTPERTTKRGAMKLVYMASPDGYAEANEKSAEIELSDEFINYF